MLNNISLSCDHLPRFTKSFWSLSMSFLVCTTLNTFVSSANFNKVQHTESSMSLIYIRNWRDPRAQVLRNSAFYPSPIRIASPYNNSISQSTIHLNISPAIPKAIIFIICLLCGTLSKTFGNPNLLHQFAHEFNVIFNAQKSKGITFNKQNYLVAQAPSRHSVLPLFFN